jgi:hypothetical protein
MSNQIQLKAALAAFGFAMGGLLFAYLEYTNYARLRPIMLCTSIVLCPPGLLSTLFLDIEPHSGEAIMAWSVIAGINATLYATIGGIVLRFIGKSKHSPREKPQR